MSKLINRRDFLRSAAPLVAAPLILGNRNVIAAPREKAAMMPPPLEILYDTLGNATDGWGWAGQGGYPSVFSDSLALNYSVVTCYIGTLTSPKRLRGLECAVAGRNSQSNTPLPPSYFLGRFYIGIWRTDVGTFYQTPLGGSLTLLHANLSDPNVGSVSTPVSSGGVTPGATYVIGWDNLDVLLPANVPIQMAFYVEGVQLGDGFGVRGSSRPGPNMLEASSDTGNGIIGQPMACRVTVSDANPTAANCEISGRVVNLSGRGIARARVILQNAVNGETVSTLSNPFGYFRFNGLPTTDFYILSVSAKGHAFAPDTQSFQLTESVSDMLFVGR